MDRANIPAFRQKDLREREARVLALRRRFERASRKGGGLARAGRWLLVAFWCVCLTIIGAGLNKLHPEFGERLAYAVRDPADGVTRPFASCAAAHAAGVYDIPRGSPAYVQRQDGDDDGLACEPAPGEAPAPMLRASTAWNRWSGYPGA